MTGRIFWHDLETTDPDAAAAFYIDVVGWSRRQEGPDYSTWVAASGPVAGLRRLSPEAAAHGAAPYWRSTVSVTDVDALTAKARAKGAKVYVEPMDAPGLRFSLIGDPRGAPIAIARTMATLSPRDLRRPGELSWDELAAPDGEESLRFYGDLFGWTSTSEAKVGQGTYRVLARDRTPVAGMYSDASLRQGWLIYVQVTDLEAAVKRAKRDGGTVLAGPEAIPGGRMAQLKDPQGAVFGLRETTATR